MVITFLLREMTSFSAGLKKGTACYGLDIYTYTSLYARKRMRRLHWRIYSDYTCMFYQSATVVQHDEIYEILWPVPEIYS